jgi:hypothetical protein
MRSECVLTYACTCACIATPQVNSGPMNEGWMLLGVDARAVGRLFVLLAWALPVPVWETQKKSLYSA